MEYRMYEGFPPYDILESVMHLYETIFQTSSENIRSKMQKVDRLLVLVALDNGKVVGFKVGYEQDANEFYSWIGGVHDLLKEHGYSVVTTTTEK